MKILRCEINLGNNNGICVETFNMDSNWQDKVRVFVEKFKQSSLFNLSNCPLLKMYKSESDYCFVKTTSNVNGKHIFAPDRVIPII